MLASEKIRIQNASLKAQVIGQQKEIASLNIHLADMRTLVNRLTECNVKIEYKKITKGR